MNPLTRFSRIWLPAILLVSVYITSSCTAEKAPEPASAHSQAQSVQHPKWSKNLAIYEANIRQFSEAGDFKSFEAYLPELQKMGIGIVWLMPIHPIGELNRKGGMGSYYSVRDYKAINPEFGTAEDLHRLVNKVHELGMYVIIDWVANHTAWDHPWTESHPEFYTRDSLGNFVPPVADWSDVIDLDYGNPELRRAMIDALAYWVREFNIDGYRCDVAAMVPTDFWLAVRDTLDKIKPVFMLAEAHEPELHAAFDMTYGWQYKDLMNNIAAGKQSADDLDDHYRNEEIAEYPSDAYRMLFTTNHDENSWQGTVFERLDGGAEAFAVFTGVFRGMPLLYSGQEAGMDKRLAFFEKDPIEWREHPFREVYTRLFNLKRENRALWNGDAGGDVQRLQSDQDSLIYSFIREKDGDRVVALFNFSSEAQTFTIASPQLAGTYHDVFSGDNVTFSEQETFSLDAWGYRVVAGK